ncbi:single-stranded-DNA-specific exonuclease RecJ [Propylenella binzhouense]|uniref:Single-stranded-DNA-specific exonuclease RecJ n=1 Tax=Propylenella binzhouense TaxID=2555902 RepID=A0A964T3F6_9HYPH|nr:single-stranded-DNA-specific exonuclease RecJ [Propylenella binzhouense]MYZ47753.1 single-stranded-DNA-specific exonuclease RecJ [Propylenella binzhouense]
MWGFGEDGRDAARPFLGVTRSAAGRAWRSRLDGRAEGLASAMVQRHGLSEIVARVLAGRGVECDRASDFLEPSLRRDLPDPSSLADMDAAACRLADAVHRAEPVAIFGDYDVDGATSSALLASLLEGLGCPVRIYVPDRIFEGYGPNPAAIETLVSEGAGLIVCVDCGSTSTESLAVARRLGADVVVIDHHQVGVELPPAVAIVNPNRQDDVSGQGHLAAVGVTFLAAVATVRELRRRGFFAARREPDLLTFLDLVALGTVCDIVPLVGVNRALVSKGLITLRHNLRPGIRALAEAARLKRPSETGHLGFLLGPRINAGGRIGDAGLGARLLTCLDPGEAAAIAATLDRLNAERQAIEAEAVAEAVAEAEAEIGAGPGPAVLLASSESWHPGVVGLVAARLKERFERPAVAVTFEGGSDLGTASGRSITGVDLGAAVRAAVEAGILVKGGGHAMAAGLTVARERMAELRSFLDERLGEATTAARADRTMLLDGALTESAATAALIDALERAGPYGPGHPAPVFAFPSHRVVYAERAGGNHVRARLSAGTGGTLKAIAFRCADGPVGRALLEGRGRPLHVAGTLCLDTWQGAATPQLRILDAAVPGDRV